MKLHAIRTLHKSMLDQGIDIQKFEAEIGSARFNCLFSTREEPFMLSLTSTGSSPVQLLFPVVPGYRINSHFGDKYGELRKKLGKGWPKGKKVTPASFFELLESQVPSEADPGKIPHPHEILELRHDLEDIDKPYFDAWIFWDKEEDKGPSEQNLKKTLLLKGVEAYHYSKKNNASSRWHAGSPESRALSKMTKRNKPKSYHIEFLGKADAKGKQRKAVVKLESFYDASKKEIVGLIEQAITDWAGSSRQGKAATEGGFRVEDLEHFQDNDELRKSMKKFGVIGLDARVFGKVETLDLDTPLLDEH